MSESRPKILVVEDEAKIARFIELELTHEGYEVDKADNGRAGVDAALSAPYDLILLDILLPQLNGMEVLRRIRRVSEVPVIMLTARDAVMDKVAGLDAGADDYLTKPFAIEELLARIRVALKRHEALEAAREPAAPVRSTPDSDRHVLEAKGVMLDVERREVTVAGKPVRLTQREFDLLQALMEAHGIVLTREQLAERALGYDYVGETNVVDVHIRHLRAKIDTRLGAKLITTVRGVGYAIR